VWCRAGCIRVEIFPGMVPLSRHDSTLPPFSDSMSSRTNRFFGFHSSRTENLLNGIERPLVIANDLACFVPGNFQLENCRFRREPLQTHHDFR